MSRFWDSMAIERSSARDAPRGMRIGDRFGKEVAFTEDSIRQFATYVGDSNPLHHDQAAAAASSFGWLIASGIKTFSMMLVGGPDYLPPWRPNSGWEQQGGLLRPGPPGA